MAEDRNVARRFGGQVATEQPCSRHAASGLAESCLWGGTRQAAHDSRYAVISFWFTNTREFFLSFRKSTD